MFTGIVKSLGQVEFFRRGSRLALRAGLRGMSLGDSIAVNGVCLTLAKTRSLPRKNYAFEFDLGPETLKRTTLGTLRPGEPVNLEPALRASDRLGGHLVSGHVDARARVLDNEPLSGGSRRPAVISARRLRVELPKSLAPFVAPQGSITVDGVSLTVTRLSGIRSRRGWFETMLIPHTLRHTTLGALEPSQFVNLEADLLARYLRRKYRPGRGGRRK